MAKPSPNNAFTMTETLMVLLLVGLLSTIVLPRYDATELAARQIKALCLQAQMHAYASKETITVEIGVDSARCGDTRYDFPEKMACTPLAFSYNGNGNISKGGSTTCLGSRSERRIVFQLGMGRVRIE